MNQAELDLFNDKLDAHAKEVERFHGEVANVTRQIANCDKLVRLANAGLSQIDGKIAEAVRVSAEAQLLAEELRLAVAHLAYKARAHGERLQLQASTAAVMALQDDAQSLLQRLNLALAKAKQPPYAHSA